MRYEGKLSHKVYRNLIPIEKYRCGHSRWVTLISNTCVLIFYNVSNALSASFAHSLLMLLIFTRSRFSPELSLSLHPIRFSAFLSAFSPISISTTISRKNPDLRNSSSPQPACFDLIALGSCLAFRSFFPRAVRGSFSHRIFWSRAREAPSPDANRMPVVQDAFREQVTALRVRVCKWVSFGSPSVEERILLACAHASGICTHWLKLLWQISDCWVFVSENLREESLVIRWLRSE